MPVSFFRLLFTITVCSSQNVYSFWYNFDFTEVSIEKNF